MSQHFCGTCNRLRLRCDGVLHPCLGDLGAVDLGDVLAARDDGPQEAAIMRPIALKPEHHGFGESAGVPGPYWRLIGAAAARPRDGYLVKN